MTQRWTLSVAEYRANFDAYVSQQILAGKKVVVEFVSEHRSLDQNSMIHAVYKQIAEQKQDESMIDIRRHCKAYYGVPILLAEDKAFAAMYRKGIMVHLNTEEKLLAMDILPITSRMNKTQASTYIDTIIKEYSQQGLCLLHPSEQNDH